MPGVFTVSVAREDGVSPSAIELEKYFATDAGRAALARDGRAESVEILEMKVDGNLLYLRVTDESSGDGTDAEVWRALFDLGGHFTSVSLFGPADQPIDRDEGLATLLEQVRELRTANQTVSTYPQETAEVRR